MASKNKRYFFAVGQRSFEAVASANHFSTVIPIADTSGQIIEDRKSEFPNRGRAWWMLRGETRITHAPPGCLIMSGIEDSMDHLSTKPDKDIYQLLQPTLPGMKDLLEILKPDAAITDPNELLDNFRMRCDHEPTRHVFVRLGDHLYGPLKVEFDRPENDRLIEPEVRFTKPIVPDTVYRIEAAEAVGRPGYIRHKVVVQRNASRPNDQLGHTVTYEAITGALYEELREGAGEVEIVSLREAVRQVSRDFLPKRERRQFLERLGRFADESQSSNAAIARVRHFLEVKHQELDALDQLFESLLSDEGFKPKIDQAIATEVRKRVDTQAAQIDARAKERVKELNIKLEQLKEELEAESERLEGEKTRRHKTLEGELETKRKAVEQELEAKRGDLRRQEESIIQSLEAVADRLASDRTGVINDFLALEPLLRRLGLGGTQQSDEHQDTQTAAQMTRHILPLPDYQEDTSDHLPIAEDDFFERFLTHVEECGFVFDREDVLAFHLSAKERAPVILGGVSGSGKSSLPVLYAEALAGEGDGDKRFLVVDVNPSWTNPSDLLGYTDALEHRFIPASSGMLTQMIHAHHAHKVLGSSAPVFSVCLEELNLAQPEHYLADIVQAISRAPGNQFISVFDPNAVRNDDPFHSFARLELSPNLIIVGTVNFDETTRPLSTRLLDRCNLIEFTVGERLPVLDITAQTGVRQAGGRQVLLSDRNRWARNTNVPARAIDVLNDIQLELSTLGCGLTHRRQTLICRFLANAPESLCSFDQALDMQLCQRILPQIRRRLYLPSAMEALRRLSGKLEKACDVPRTLEILAKLEADERSAGDLFLREE